MAEGRERVLRATVRTLADKGFARTTARAIAGTGGFAPGVIYYHFEDLDDLFVAAMRHTSQDRMRRYSEEVTAATTAVDLLARLRRLYDEDTAEGHIAAVAELVGAANAAPKLAEEVRRETAVWQEFAEGVLDRQLGGTVFAALAPVKELARTAVATYLGMQVLAHLDRDHTAVHELFDAAATPAAMLDAYKDD